MNWSFSFQWEQLTDYFFSAYTNSLQDLTIFVIVLSALFLGRHYYLNKRMHRARQSIPLVLGGWGTRGKSGTERIKAGLINAMGFSIISKTTGCEAMFLNAYTYGTLREMFLFRPYDKATIWEQTNIMRLAEKLGAEVFLWECMGLTPSYVDVLQRQWTKDDISTITNTYPDHEDLQGPAGVDVTDTIATFIPPNGNLLTTEEVMYPTLRDIAASRNTRIKSVGWKEAGLLTPDVLARFPYEEHPYNIALVIAMGHELGVTEEFSVKSMADYVVADLGVLKTHPPAPVKTRRLEFINGCSANERFGCINNWRRMNFDTQDIYQEPGIWITTVVNNRADRVPRSRVFAQLLVDTLSADRHFLIGTNLTGLQGYIRESWNEYTSGLTLWPRVSGDESHKADPVDELDKMSRFMRVPLSDEDVAARLQAMLQGIGRDDAKVLSASWNDIDNLRQSLSGSDDDIISDIVYHIEQNKQALQEYASLKQKIESAAGASDELDKQFRDQLWQWLERKISVVEDSHATGEQVVDHVCRETPPGIYNRVMGLQNIKGTGLDFVYRWQAWERCYDGGQLLLSDDVAEAKRGLEILSQFQEFGVLSEEYTRGVLQKARSGDTAQSELFQAELQSIETNLDVAMTKIDAQLKSSSGGPQGGFVGGLLDSIEAFLDAGDAVKRRKKANLIYKDLAAERISNERAVTELKALTKRQKGGWLRQQVLQKKKQKADRAATVA